MKQKKYLYVMALLLVAAAIFVFFHKSISLQYYVNLKDRTDDRINITLHVHGIEAENDVFHFVATAPGTYQVLDVGRFVRGFKAFDENGDSLKTTRIGENEWKIDNISDLETIQYGIADFWDTPVDSNAINPFFGLSIEDDHVLLNSHCVFGYFKGLKNEKISVQFERPEKWQVGTPLKPDDKGLYYVNNFSELIDSPFLFGEISKATVKVKDTQFDIFCYSNNGQIQADTLRPLVERAMNAESAFFGQLPLQHYTFLFHFGNPEAHGGLEHNFSSVYAFQDGPLDQEIAAYIEGAVAHEVFHILTPLTIRSNKLVEYNYEKPEGTRHLWFYEGITEWASDAMLLRDSALSIEQFLAQMQLKLNISQLLDTTYSLTKIGQDCYSIKGRDQMENMYHRGAVVASLLDIKLLELSKGEMGLRELMFKLRSIYDKENGFDDDQLFHHMATLTYPEIGVFLDDYVVNNKPLPISESYALIGVDYRKNAFTGKRMMTTGFEVAVINSRDIEVRLVDSQLKAMGLQNGDRILTIDGIDVSVDNSAAWVGRLQALKVGERYVLTLRRSEALSTISCMLIEKDQVIKNQFTMLEPTDAQKELRERWSEKISLGEESHSVAKEN